MAKYILLAFDEDAEADEFVLQTRQQSAVWISAPSGMGNSFVDGMSELKATVCAVYKKPTKFCECSGHSGPYTRGRKYGWWVHARKGCGKPTRWWADGQHWFVVLGNNLLAAAGREKHLLPEVGANAEQVNNTETTGPREG